MCCSPDTCFRFYHLQKYNYFWIYAKNIGKLYKTLWDCPHELDLSLLKFIFDINVFDEQRYERRKMEETA